MEPAELTPQRIIDRNTTVAAVDAEFPMIDVVLGGVTVRAYDRDPHNLRDVFLRTREYDSRTAIVFRDERFTFADQWRTTVAFANGLQTKFGIKQGDRVAIAMRNYPEWVFSFWAAQLLGAIAFPINAWLAAAELGPILADADPSIIVADAERLARIEEVIATHGPVPVITVRGGEATGRTITFAEVTAGQDDEVMPTSDCSPDDPAAVLYTSGTTGKPKGAVTTHRNHVSALIGKMYRSALGQAHEAHEAPAVRLINYPFFHIAGISTMYNAAYFGQRMVLMYKWDAAEAIRLIDAEGVSETAGPPFVVRSLVDAAAEAKEVLPTLRTLGMGGSAAPSHLIRAIDEQFGGRVSPRAGYGMTETSSAVFMIGGRELVTRPDSSGRIHHGMEVRILAEDGQALPIGGRGEIAIKGAQVAAGYWNSPEGAAQRFSDGWFHTGDIGRLDEEGYLYVVGRIKDIVIRGGENIDCAEIEDCLSGLADIVEVGAFPLPHDTLGEELAVAVRLVPGSPLTAQAIRDYAATRLAGFKVPSQVYIIGAPLPRTESGKVIKRQLPAAVKIDNNA